MPLGKKKNHVTLGTCGIYVVLVTRETLREHAPPLVLVHRRASHVSEGGKIAVPGGVVKSRSGDTCFYTAARHAALRELKEEAGIDLIQQYPDDMQLIELPVDLQCMPHGFPRQHKNFCVVTGISPLVGGPEQNGKGGIEPGGMDGMGEAAGDGYHAWVKTTELLQHPDLMHACKTPLRQIENTRHNYDFVQGNLERMISRVEQSGREFLAETWTVHLEEAPSPPPRPTKRRRWS